MSSVPNNSVRPPRGRITRRMLLVLISLMILPLVVIGTTIYFYGRDFYRQQAIKMLDVLADVQRERILYQVEGGAIRLSGLLGSSDFQTDLDALLKLDDPSDPNSETIKTSLLDQLEADLSPDLFAAAQERGRARDLDATVAELVEELGA